MQEDTVNFKIILLGILFFGILGLAKTSWAASWYVDNAATGADNGTSWTDAWTSFGNIVWGSSGVKAGDSLYISGGTTSKTYTAKENMMLLVGADGTLDKPITIKPGAASPYPSGHSGTVIFDGANSYYWLILSSRPNIYINGNDGSENRQFKFQNLRIDGTKVAAPAVQVGEHSKVSYCEFATVERGIKTDNYAEVDHNYFHDIRAEDAAWIAPSIPVEDWDINLIHDNIVELNFDPTSGGPDGFKVNSGTSIYNNTVSATYAAGSTVGTQHPDGVESFGQYVKIYNNTFSDLANSCANTGPTNSTFGHWYFYNNVCRQTSESIGKWLYLRGVDFTCTGGTAICTAITDVKFYSNTFVDLTSGYAIGIGTISAGATIDNFEIKNNIMLNCSAAITNLAGSGYIQEDFTIDKNLVNAGPHGGTGITIDGLTYTQATGWINTDDPTSIFTSYTEGSGSNNYQPRTGSMALNVGFNLGSPFNRDIVGTSRPQGPAWDIGAYEYVQGRDTTPPGAPTGLSVN